MRQKTVLLSMRDVWTKNAKAAFARVQEQVFVNAVLHGWWGDGGEDSGQGQRTFPELIALIHSELSEALEEYRNGHDYTEVYVDPTYSLTGEPDKPEGIPIELADVIIRVFDVAQFYQINLVEALRLKMEYNITRPPRHGGKLL